MIAAVGAALDAAVRRINFEAAVAAAKYCLGKYLGGYGVSERWSSEWLLHHLFWSRGEEKSFIYYRYWSGNHIVLITLFSPRFAQKRSRF